MGLSELACATKVPLSHCSLAIIHSPGYTRLDVFKTCHSFSVYSAFDLFSCLIEKA